MKILILIHEYPPVGGGGGRVAQDIAENLNSKGHEIHVITSSIKDLPLYEERSGVFIHRVRCMRRQAYKAHLVDMALYILMSIFYSIKLIKKNHPSILHAHFAVPAGFAAFVVSGLSKIPYIITSHLGDVPGGVPQKTGKIFPIIYPLTKAIWKNAAKIIAISQHTKELIKASYPFVDPVVLYNAANLPFADPTKIQLNRPTHIVFAGRLVPQKNPLQIVRTLEALKALQWRCTLVGDGPMREDVEKEISKSALIDRIQITGWVKPEEVLDIYDQSDILFMPSQEEGLPVAGVQAIAKGLAVVLSDVGDCKTLVEEGKNGHLVNTSHPENFGEALKTMLKNPKKLLAYRKASIQHARNFNIENIAASYEDIMRQIAH